MFVAANCYLPYFLPYNSVILNVYMAGNLGKCFAILF